MAKDEGPRADTTAEALAKLKPVFHAKGSVTAGNSSQTSDGAAVALVMSLAKAEELGLKPKARFVSFAVGGVPPEVMGIGPKVAIPKALRMAGLTLDQIGVIELNEAFAVQSVAVTRALGLDASRVNVRGGAIALGHPIGSSGARIACTLVHAMRARDKKLGLASLCIGVGQGIATLFERV